MHKSVLTLLPFLLISLFKCIELKVDAKIGSNGNFVCHVYSTDASVWSRWPYTRWMRAQYGWMAAKVRELFKKKWHLNTLQGCLSLWPHSSQSVALCPAALAMACGWQLSQGYVQCIGGEGKGDVPHREEYGETTEWAFFVAVYWSNTHTHIYTQWHTTTHSPYPIMKTPLLTLSVACRPLYVYYYRRALQLLLLIFICGGFWEQVWWSCWQNPPLALSQGTRN